MFTASIPLLPPPPTSLLPPFHDRPHQDTLGNSSTSNGLLSQQHQQQHRRNRSGFRHAAQSRSPLAMLSLDERAIVQRKMAIAMYGYSWLKPAGCNKTMLGRREEEIEREEVERQLREVEMQERNAMEAEEADRRARLEEQGRRERAGEDVGGDEGERDLDDDVPDMDADADNFDEDDEEEEEDDEGVDLDADVPEADSNWQYDTTRDLDTESEANQSMQEHPNQSSARRPGRNGRDFQSREDHEAAEQEALVNAMLDEDELGEIEFQQRDLDDDLPDMDADMSMAMDNDERDLDDDVPEADGEDGWEHTDTELEDSEMDISILPSTLQSATRAANPAMPPPTLASSTDRHRGQGTRRAAPRYSSASEQSETYSSMRRISGNMLPPPPNFNLSRSQGQSRASHQPQPRRSPRTHIQTPSTTTSNVSVSALISTGNTTDLSSGIRPTNAAELSSSTRSRNWLNPAGTRRNLFGSLRGPAATATTVPQGVTNTSRNVSNIQNQAPGGMITNSSGGLFTPSPRVASGLGPRTRHGQLFEAEDTPEPDLQEEDEEEEAAGSASVQGEALPASRTRSGRLHGLTYGRRAADRQRARERGAWDDT